MPNVRVDGGTAVHYAEQWNFVPGGQHSLTVRRADDPAELDILLGTRGVYDVADSAYGALSDTDALNNNTVVQAAANAADAAGGGILVISRDVLFRPRATQAVALGTNTTVVCTGGAAVMVDTANSPHATVNGAQTLTGTPGTLTAAGATGFEASGTLLFRGSTEDSVANGSYTGVTASAFTGAMLTGATTLAGAHTLPVATISVRSTSGFGSAGTINVGGQIVTYTGKTTATIDTTTGLTTGTFTGCTGGTGTIADGAAVTANSLVLPDGAGIGQAAQVFQNKDSTNGNDDIVFDGVTFLGPGRLGSTLLNDLTTKALRLLTNTSNTTGPTGWCNRPRIEGCVFRDWAGPQIHAFNVKNYHIDDNTFTNGWRGGIIGGNDSHRGTINGNVFEQNHDDCINWQGRGTIGGNGLGATYPTRFTISGNLIQEADFASETAQLNNGIVVKGAQFFTIAANTVEGSDESSSLAAGISIRSSGIADAKHGAVLGNTIVNTGAQGILLAPGDLVASGGSTEDILLEANEIYGTQNSGIFVSMRNAAAQLVDLTIRGGQLRDCGAVTNQAAAIRVQTSNGVVGPLVTGLTVDGVTITGAGEQAVLTDSVTSLKTLRLKNLTIRNPNRLGTASTDAIKIDASAVGAALTDYRIVDNDITVDNANSVRFAVVVLAGANAADGRISNRIIKSQFATGAYSITAGGARIAVEHTNRGAVVALSDVAVNVLVDATLGDYFTLAATKNHTITAPTGMQAGWEITYDISNATAGAITTTWNAAHHLAGAWVDPAGAGTPAKRRTITFRSVTDDGGATFYWVEKTRAAADI